MVRPGCLCMIDAQYYGRKLVERKAAISVRSYYVPHERPLMFLGFYPNGAVRVLDS